MTLTLTQVGVAACENHSYSDEKIHCRNLLLQFRKLKQRFASLFCRDNTTNSCKVYALRGEVQCALNDLALHRCSGRHDHHFDPLRQADSIQDRHFVDRWSRTWFDSDLRSSGFSQFRNAVGTALLALA